MNSKTKGVIYAILSAVAFGAMPIFAKLAYNNGSNSTTVLAVRFLLASLTLFIYFKIKRQNFKINKKQLYILCALGVFGYTITSETLFMSYSYLSVGLATTVHFIYPAVVCLIGYLFFKERIGKMKLIALILSIIGVFILVGFENKTISILGVTLALISGVSYGANIIGLSLEDISSLDNKISTFYISIFSGVTMLILAILTKRLSLAINTEIFVSYIGISLVSTITSIIFLLKAIEEIGATSASILATFEPIVSIILGVLFFKESFTFPMLIGTMVILISVIIIAKSKEEKVIEKEEDTRSSL